jgi:Uma2 family endonuclease
MPVLLTAPSSEQRLGFTVEDVRRMLRAGILDDERRYELIEGEIIPVQAHNPPHMRVKRWLYQKVTLALGEDYWVDSESSLYLDPKHEYALPDVFVYPRALGPEEVRGRDVLWLIEVADSTIAKDRGLKARLYARHGVKEYWVVEARTRITWIYRDPEAGAYPEPVKAGGDDVIAPRAFPHIQLRMNDTP